VKRVLSFFSGILGRGESSDRISAEDLLALVESDAKVTIIDVRTPSEYRAGHIQGSVSIPLDTLDGAKVASTGKVVLCCASGVRSVSGRKVLEARGLKDVVDLKGGLKAWAGAGGKVVTGKRP
jgi:rhodanese-related sulfurtransferase